MWERRRSERVSIDVQADGWCVDVANAEPCRGHKKPKGAGNGWNGGLWGFRSGDAARIGRALDVIRCRGAAGSPLFGRPGYVTRSSLRKICCRRRTSGYRDTDLCTARITVHTVPIHTPGTLKVQLGRLLLPALKGIVDRPFFFSYSSSA